MANRGAWAPATAYAAGDTVTALGDGFVCSVAHTSSADFEHDAAYWSDQTPAVPGVNGTSSTVTSTDQSGTTYTLALADGGTLVRFTNASAVTVTVPTNASVAFPTGTVINVYSVGAAGVTVAAAGGVTIRNNTVSLTQYGECSLRKDGTDEWVRVG